MRNILNLYSKNIPHFICYWYIYFSPFMYFICFYSHMLKRDILVQHFYITYSLSVMFCLILISLNYSNDEDCTEESQNEEELPPWLLVLQKSCWLWPLNPTERTCLLLCLTEFLLFSQPGLEPSQSPTQASKK